MRHLLAIALSSLLLAACGGSSEPETEISLDGHNIQVASVSWISYGNIVREGESPGCPMLVVSARFSATPGPFPQSIAVGTVRMFRDGAPVWQVLVDPAENYLDTDGVLKTAARGCLPEGLQSAQRVVVVYELTGTQGTARLASPEVTIEIAY
jgi:hypothetical protein